MFSIMKTDDTFYKKPFLFVFKNRLFSEIFQTIIYTYFCISLCLFY